MFPGPDCWLREPEPCSRHREAHANSQQGRVRLADVERQTNCTAAENDWSQHGHQCSKSLSTQSSAREPCATRIRCNVRNGARQKKLGALLLYSVVFSCLLLESNVAQNAPPAGANSRTFNPVLRWGRQVLFDCSKYNDNLECEPGFEGMEPERVQEPGNWKACTSNPAVQYECSTTNIVGCQCNGLCLPVGERNGTCYDMLLGLEDNWIKLGTRVLHNPRPDDPSLNEAIGFEDYGDDFILVSLNVSYGSLDVYGSSVQCDKWCPREACVVCDENCPDMCRVGKGNITRVPLTRVPLLVSYAWDRAILNVTDNWERLDQHLISVKYRPEADMNTYKLRRERMQSQPWELLNMKVLYNNPSYSSDVLRAVVGPWIVVGTFVQLVHIVDLNDPPSISPPVTPSAKCTPEELGPGEERPEQCFFGSYFSLEDTSDRREIQGVTVTDADLDERCPLGEECARIDIEVRAFKGALSLNTRSNLEFYDIGDPDNRAGWGFTAYLTAAQNAIKVLFYQVELGQFLGPSSKVLDYNTQHGGNLEYFSVTASDQGANSWNGLSSFSTIQVPIQIVATNDPPVITLEQSEFEAIEDVEQPLLGISIFDVDVAEPVESQLAFEDWLGAASTSIFMNQMLVTATVQYGKLKLGYTRNLQLVSASEVVFASQDASIAWVTIEPFRFGHDACLIDGIREDESALKAAYPAGADTIQAYSKICLLENLGSPSCQTGDESGCRCTTEGTCTSDKVVLYLNASKPIEAFRTALTEAISSTNKTCGGMPVYRNPNNFTQGKLCASNEDCRYLEQCTPLVDGEAPTENTCRCCSDINVFCADNSPCSALDTGSLCGCMPGGSGGLCGPFYTRADRLGAVEYDLIRVGDVAVAPRLFGSACQYRGPGLQTCQAPAYAYGGSNLAKIANLVALESRGSSNFTFFGPIVDVNRAMAALVYISNDNYNRFYRPPVEEQEVGFNIEADSVDVLDIVADDMGNSGGLRRDPKSSQVQATVRVMAVNDVPNAFGPAQVKAFEDLPLTFQDGDPHPLRADRLMFLDPDSEDYRYGEQILTMNLSCTHGRLFLNEDYLIEEWAKTMDEFGEFDASRSAITYVEWPGVQRRGLHYYDLKLGRSFPKFGHRCQFEPQCSNGDTLKSKDIRYGFFNTSWFGVVYSPQVGDYALKDADQGESEPCRNRIEEIDCHARPTATILEEGDCSDDLQGCASCNVEGLPMACYRIRQTSEPFAFPVTFFSQCLVIGKCDSLTSDCSVERESDDLADRTVTSCEHGCGNCNDEVGNKFLSIQGTLSSINKALEKVTYLPDPDFNTRFGNLKEEIIFEVNDNGARGEDSTASPLTHRRVIDVIVESVNDRPFIGVRKRHLRNIKGYDGGQTPDRQVEDFVVEKIDKTIEEECFSLAPSSDEYWEKCNPDKRRFIDIDEDTQFFIGPQVLWIVDIDSDEAEQMPSQRRYCCAEAGEVACVCGRSCRCGNALCKCSVPEVCQGGAGKLLVSLKVDNGQLSFYPPPGREVFPMDDVTFLQNLTSIDIKEGGFTEPCPNQLDCMVNVSRIMMMTNIESLQQGLEQLFLSYQGRADQYGRDELEIWVSDQGYTDECYNATLAVVETISIRVVGINDPPKLREPGSVLVYQRGQKCYVDWHEFDTSETGMIHSCTANPNISLVPPSPALALAFEDVDLGDTPDTVAEMTVSITIGNDGDRHGKAGNLMFAETLERTNVWLTEFEVEGLTRMMIQGSIDDINWLMQRLRYDADDTYQGYAPFVVNVNDNLNYGECNGRHVCGAFEAVCMDHTKAEPHLPPDPGLNRVVLDVVIGSAVRCQATDCETCNEELGCGWCPGACTEAGGKCMIGSASGPQFESCEADATGRGWMMCELPIFDAVTLGAAVGGALFVFAILFYIFYRWVRRRHGSLVQYLKKKRRDTALVMTKLNILPPPDANYNQFFALGLLGIGIIILMPLLATSNPQCTFQRNFFLDKIASVDMKLDNCKVRFLPPRFSPPPENALEAPKIKLAFLEDPDVILEADSCTQDATFELINNRPDSVKYLGYYCNIEILVPDRYVLPEFSIEAAGDNTTSVRVSATDSDSTDFGLDFGPNRFTLTGNRLVANVQNISAKFFNYEVVHGSLIALDLATTVSGTFTSNDADMTVTTKFRTSVDFWQKSGNKVCLTAATMYVDDACQEICELKTANTSSSTSRRRSSDDHDILATYDMSVGSAQLRATGSNTSILHGLVITDPVAGDNRSKWICNGDPDADEEWSCEPYDAQKIALSQPCPVGSRYATKADVPQIDGCTNLEFCLLEESSQCLCKPTCDMAGLDPPGTCNEGGQCCQITCAGYSKADLFPADLADFFPNDGCESPPCEEWRCGARIDDSLTWCDNQLDQKFTFTSDVGQIALQVLEGCLPDSPSECDVNKTRTRYNSYKGSTPTEGRILTGIDIPADNKQILDDLFHPGGASAPKADWFTLGLHGPGTADESYGQFVFLKDIRHLVLEPWLMNVLSYGLLAPERGASSSNLNPGFCPAFLATDGTEFNTRLAEMYKVLLDTVQLYPPPPPPPEPQDEDEKIIPVNSLISFRRVSGTPSMFVTDSTTGSIAVVSVKSGDYPLLILLLILGVLIPVMAASGGSLVLFLRGRTHLHDYRQSKLMQEHLMRNLGAVLAGGGPDPDDDDDVPRERVKEMRGRTGFFYMYEEFVGNAEAQRTLFAQWGLVLSELIVALLPPVFPFMIAGIVETSYKAHRCEYRYDTCRCMSETGGVLIVPWVLRILIYVYFFVTLLELGLHYLTVSYNWFRKVLRALFYVLFFLMLWLTIVTTGTLFIFCILGVLVRPTLTAPYASCVLGTVVVLGSMFVKRTKLMMRVSRGVTKRVVAYKNKVADNMPKPLLDAMMSKYIAQALHDHGLSVPKIVISIVMLLIALTAIFFFLFQGFDAFTDASDLNSALINVGIIVGVIVGAYQTVVADGDAGEVAHRVEQLTASIMTQLEQVLDMIASQIKRARELYDEMRALDGDINPEDDSSASYASEDDEKQGLLH